MYKKSLSNLTVNIKRLMSLLKSRGIDWTKQEKILMEPFYYIRKVPCKHHSLMAPAFNHWLQVPEKKVEDIQDAILTLNVWSILTDDIQDNSAFRYGIPSTHTVYGMGLAINAAGLAILKGGNQVTDLGHPLAWKVFSKRIKEYLDGQGSDIYWRDNQLLPTVEEHMEMAKKKVGSFFAFPIELMQLFSKSDKDYTELASNIGLYYSIIDDYYNLFQPKAMQSMALIKQDNFNIISDITESKITLPVIHAMQFPDVAPELADILNQRTTDPKLMNRVISLLKKHGSDEFMRDMLRGLETSIFKEIDELGGNKELKAIIDDIGIHFHQSDIPNEKR